MTDPMKIIRMPLDALRPDPANEKDHSDEKHRETLRASLKDYGQVEPLIVRTGTGVLIGGHGRLEIMSELGWTHADVVEYDGSDDQVAQLRIALNRTGELSTWNPEALHRTLEMLKKKDYDLKRIGFTMPDFKEVGVKAHQRKVIGAIDTGPPAPPKTPESKMGEIYQLGPHRLACGDSTDASVHNDLLGSHRYGCWWTDPPYGVDYEGVAGKLQNDGLGPVALGSMLSKVFDLTFERTRPGGAVYVSAPDNAEINYAFATELLRLGVWRQTLIWNKSSLVLGRMDYHYKHESIFYGWVPGSAHSWLGDRKQTTVIDVDKPSANPDHPTMKPIELITKCLANSAEPGDLVVDPFAGSGSTLIAAATLGLKARCIELDPRFADVIRKRWTAWALSAGVDPGPGALE